jgi:hypothetical protein
LKKNEKELKRLKANRNKIERKMQINARDGIGPSFSLTNSDVLLLNYPDFLSSTF